MNPEEKQACKLGPGGYKCRCCGPSPKDRPKWRRLIRHRLVAIHRKIIRNASSEVYYDIQD